MAAYMETAAKANEVAQQLLALLPEANKIAGSILMAKLVNLGVRVSPRGVHHTVRKNAVQGAMRGLPVTVRMEEVQGQDRYGRPKTFNALIVNGNNADAGVSDEDSREAA